MRETEKHKVYGADFKHERGKNVSSFMLRPRSGLPFRSCQRLFGLFFKKQFYDGIPVALSLYAFGDRVHVALIQHAGIALLKLNQTSLSLSFTVERFRIELLEIASFHDNPYILP